MKAFLAAEQRFPGIGNGVLQDILLESGINPKRKISTLRDLEKDNLLRCVIEVLRNMAAHGGRDTEKDIYGRQGGYKVCLSRNTLASGCPKCGGKITKETYWGVPSITVLSVSRLSSNNSGVKDPLTRI